MKMEDYKKVMDKIQIKEECRKEIIDMSIEKNNSKHRWSKKKIIPVFAVAVIGCTAMTAAFADDIVSVFSKANAKQEITAEGADGTQHKVDKADQLNYSELENHAQTLSESCETDGLKVKAESAFCDGENLSVIFTAENTNPDIKNNYHIWAKGVTIEIDGKTYHDSGINSEIWIDMICDYDGASTYTGTLQFPIPEESRFTDSQDIKINVELYESAEAWSNDGVLFKGSGEFMINTAADTSSNIINDNVYTDERNNIEICQVKSTPYALSVKYKIPVTSSLVMQVFDENGNQLELNLENQGEYDGHYQTINYSSTDSKSITVQFVEENTDDLEVVCSFDIPLE
ncbi:DUF4179 domain-containing protein [Porcipelethomonas sp.]|uniref:DUF4179 domain-containing protein n=1 Tax=Porcipelethomonas sp. TaxID=2981675 RepID=UPI003EF0902E